MVLGHEREKKGEKERGCGDNTKITFSFFHLVLGVLERCLLSSPFFSLPVLFVVFYYFAPNFSPPFPFPPLGVYADPYIRNLVTLFAHLHCPSAVRGCAWLALAFRTRSDPPDHQQPVGPSTPSSLLTLLFSFPLPPIAHPFFFPCLIPSEHIVILEHLCRTKIQ